MIENQVKAAVCMIDCEDEKGTGFLVSETTVLTARHCVIAAIEHSKEICLRFPESNPSLKGEILDDSPELDVCLISLSESVNIEPIPLDCEQLQEGKAWYSRGYPAQKRTLGHRVHGNIANVRDTPKIKMDLDLAINSDVELSDFSGMSGSALIGENVCKGLIRLKIKAGLGAISIHALKDFLDKNNIETQQKVRIPVASLVDRSSFKYEFDQKLSENIGKYVFLEGQSGLGKTTFCRNFESNIDSLINLGCYSFSGHESGLGVQHRAQPKVFFEWLSTAVSKQLTGRPGRIEEKSYDQICSETQNLLSESSRYCSEQNSIGILFVDGMNEVKEAGEQLCSELIGLLPQVLPKSIVIVLTAPNYEALASKLDRRVNDNGIVRLPKLDEDVTRIFCWQRLGVHANSLLVNRICEKAEGHPLYLRYLIELVNNSEDPDILDIENFPVCSGSVSEYYEYLWRILINDADVVILLAILCRLRYGVEINLLTKILSESERSSFISTYSRIRHLLSNSTNTSIYHFSFSEFLKEKTAQLNEDIEKRLASFCIDNNTIEYCAINCIYHSLCAGEEYRNKAIELCTQSWVDSCVNYGVVQDSLLFDIEEVLEVVTKFNKAVESIRILLLSQRVNFRYNTLFHQSARLIAEALISLEKPEEAIQHCIRYNTLLIDADDAIEISNLLLQKGYNLEAVKLLNALQEQIDLQLESMRSTDSPMTLDDFVWISQYKIRCLLLLSYAEEDDDRSHVFKFLKASISVIQKTIPDSNVKEFMAHASYLQSITTGFSLRFDNEYLGLKRLKRSGYPTNIPNLYEIFILSLHEALNFDWLDSKVISSSQHLTEIFDDLEKTLDQKLYLSEEFVHHTCDTLITLGANLPLIQRTAPSKEITSKIISIKENGVDISYEDFDLGIKNKLISSFLSEDFDPPEIVEVTDTEWLEFLESIVVAMACCDGAARRAKVTDDKDLLEKVYDYIEPTLLKTLSFSLKDRVHWQDSYFIPEKILPLVFRQLSEVYLDCFPHQIQVFLTYLSTRLNAQFGLYFEGVRELLFGVLNLIISKADLSSIEDDVFDLLDQWKTTVINNIENRHELVPELLRLIPLFVKIDAKEVADQLYQHMLRVSMGPSWYKEDQFSLMNSLSKYSKNLPSELRPTIFLQIAGYLERASGEMTFRRFVRYEKANLIGEACRLGNVNQSIKYFKRQSCGALAELYAEATRGSLDRVDELRGMRYPGGAIDEQDSVLKIVHNTAVSDWRLRWGLLEIYLYGDERYVTDFATEFALLVNSQNGKSENILEMLSRLNAVICTELSNEIRIDFIDRFRVTLDENLHLDFQSIFELCPQEKKVSSSFVETKRSSNEDDEMFLPGTLGNRSSVKTSEALLAQSESKLKRGNVKEARGLAIDGLRALQEGGWSIWGSESSRLKKIINSEELDADEVTHLYSPIILREHLQPRWRVAESLLEELGNKLDNRDSALLSEYVIDHVKNIVGDATEDIKEFQFFAEDEFADSNSVLIEFIVWFLDHPDWVRKEQAIKVLAWLLDKASIYVKFIVEHAFSVNGNLGSDVICGVLDGMSLQNPIELWNKIEPYLDEGIVNNAFQHVSRLVILHRISCRAFDKGEESSGVIIAKIESFWSDKEGVKQLDELSCINSEWIKCIEKEYELLRSLNVISQQVCDSFTFELTKLCSPLGIPKTMDLEKLVSESFRGSIEQPYSRWETKIRVALNLALSKYIGQPESYEVERILRIYNPYMPMLSNNQHSSKADLIMEAIQGHISFENIVNSGSTTLIHYYEMIYVESSRKWMSVEISSVLTSSYSGFQANGVDKDSLFTSTDFIDSKKSIKGHEICYRVSPKFAILGSFTPAELAPKFILLLSMDSKKIIRSVWKNERRELWRAKREGCSLVIKQNSLRLPSGYGLSWFISIDGGLPEKIRSKRF